jgi:uridine phosphorylase
MGLLNGVDVTGGTITVGTAAADMHGYTLTFTAEEKLPAPVLTAVTNITYTSET